MKFKILCFFLILFMVSDIPLAHAGYRIKRQVPATVLNSVSAKGRDAVESVQITNSGFFNKMNSLLHPPIHRMQRRGWIGLLSFLCGLLGFLQPFFSILAILFGFIGMGRRNRNTGLAILGFLLGITVLVITIFFGFVPAL